METTVLVTQMLPKDGQEVRAYGHQTWCCDLDMQPEKAWHRCVFRFHIAGYSLKKQVPENPEESILQKIDVREEWEGEDGTHIIGVTCWKKITASV